MADLTSKTPSATYKSMLNVGTADNQELDTTLRIVEDGKGNDSDLKLATNQVRVNTKLGIGKDAAYALDVVGDIALDTNLHFGAAGTHYIKHDGGTASTDNFTFRFSDNEDVAIIRGDGKVGIGTLSPSQKLHIKDSAPRLLVEGTVASSEDAEISRISGLWSGKYVADIQFLAGDDTTNKDNGKIAFRTYTADGVTGTRMLIDEPGNVAIGTATGSPNMKLEVVAGANDGILINRNATTTDSPVEVGFRHTTSAGDAATGMRSYRTDEATSYDQELRFFTTAGSGGQAEHLTIKHDGKVGIGTTTPATPLTVKTTVDGNCLQLKSTESGALAAPNIDLFRQSSSPADEDVLGKIIFKGRNDAGGNVAYAAIYGQMMDVSDGETDGKIRMFVKKDGTDRGCLDLNSTSAIFNYSSVDINFNIKSQNNGNMFWVDAANDNVGIGAAPSSSYTFDLTRTTAGYAQRIHNSSTASASHGLLITAGKDEEHASHPLFIENQAGDDLFKITGKGTISVGGSDNTAEYILRLQARSGVDSRILIDGSGNTATSSISFQNKYGNRFSNIKGADEGSSNSGISFATGNGATPEERMRIDKDGNVGIGTTNPAADLHINNSSAEPTILLTGPGSNPANAARIRFSEQSDGNNYIELKYDGSSNTLSFDSNDQADMLSVDRTNNRVFTGTSTKVGVGTSAPATTLDVRGSVSVGQGSEVTIASGVVTVTDSYHKVDTEGDASSDNLDTINGGQIGQMLFLRQVDSGRDVVLTESGNILLPGSTFTLSNAADLCLLLYTGANWQMVSTSDNA